MTISKIRTNFRQKLNQKLIGYIVAKSDVCKVHSNLFQFKNCWLVTLITTKQINIILIIRCQMWDAITYMWRILDKKILFDLEKKP